MENKTLLGKMLGEILRIQKRIDSDMYVADDAMIYGLLNGFEHVVEEVLDRVGFVSKEKYDVVCGILDRYFDDPESISGYYDIEGELNALGVDRGDFIVIARYLTLGSRFTNVLERFDSSNSPSECRTFSGDPREL